MRKLLAFSLLLFIMSCDKKPGVGYVFPVVNPTNSYDNRSVGASAKDFLSSEKYKAINLEICYVKGHKLPDSVVLRAVDFLNRYCFKPGGVNVLQREISNQGGDLYVNDLLTIEKVYRTQYQKPGGNGADTLGLFIAVTESDYYQKDILGVAYKNTSITLFDGIISQYSGEGDKPTRAVLLSTVLEHELGHILGLVNIGTEAQSNHQDEAHGKHCDNPDCLMYYKYQTTSVLDLLNASSGVPVLDANCETDLRGNGGK